MIPEGIQNLRFISICIGITIYIVVLIVAVDKYYDALWAKVIVWIFLIILGLAVVGGLIYIWFYPLIML